MGEWLSHLTPEVQIVLIICAFSLLVIALMTLFLIVSSRGKTQNLTTIMHEGIEYQRETQNQKKLKESKENSNQDR
jgi:predicted PurR-regulated permease PerM